MQKSKRTVTKTLLSLVLALVLTCGNLASVTAYANETPDGNAADAETTGELTGTQPSDNPVTGTDTQVTEDTQSKDSDQGTQPADVTATDSVDTTTDGSVPGTTDVQAQDEGLNPADVTGDEEQPGDEQPGEEAYGVSTMALFPSWGTSKQTVYYYGLVPGATDANGDENDKQDLYWAGLNQGTFTGLGKASDYEAKKDGLTVNYYDRADAGSFTVSKNFPKLTFNGKTYTYVPTKEQNTGDTYTLEIYRLVRANGVNAGQNGFFTVINNTPSWHLDHRILLGDVNNVSFNLQEPGAADFELLENYYKGYGAGVSMSQIVRPSAADVPAEKELAGQTYLFDGWYTDRACTQPADFSGVLTGSMDFYGRYVPQPVTVNQLPVKVFVLNPERGAPTNGDDQGHANYYPNSLDGLAAGNYLDAFTEAGLNSLRGADGKALIKDQIFAQDGLGEYLSDAFYQFLNVEKRSEILLNSGLEDDAKYVIIPYVAKVQKGQGVTGTDENGTVADIHIDCWIKNVQVNVTYHRNFEAVEPEKEISFDDPANTGSDYTVKTGLADTGITSPAGYKFAGWYLDKSGTGENQEGKTELLTTGKHLYAKWMKADYSVTYKFTGAVVPTDAQLPVPAQQTYTFGSPVEVAPAVEAEGYDFSGWHSYHIDRDNDPNAEADYSGTSFIMPERDVVIFGSFSLKTQEYTVNHFYADEYGNRISIAPAKNYEALYQSVIVGDNQEKAVVPGYKYDHADPVTLTIGAKNEENVIDLYYIIDEEQKKQLTYNVNFYQEKTLVESVSVSDEVQVLKTSLPVNTDKAPFLGYQDKYEDYFYLKTEVTDEAGTVIGNQIPAEIKDGHAINIYYTGKYEVEVIANSDMLPYNGDWQEVKGYVPGNGTTFRRLDKVTNTEMDFTIEGLNDPKATGKNVMLKADGTYDSYTSEITGTDSFRIVDENGQDVTGRFKVTFTNGQLTITKKEVVITVKPASKYAGEEDPEFMGTVETPFEEQDQVKVTYKRIPAAGTTPEEEPGVYEDVLVAEYAAAQEVLNLNPTVMDNYDVTVNVADFTIGGVRYFLPAGPWSGKYVYVTDGEIGKLPKEALYNRMKNTEAYNNIMQGVLSFEDMEDGTTLGYTLSAPVETVEGGKKYKDIRVTPLKARVFFKTEDLTKGSLLNGAVETEEMVYTRLMGGAADVPEYRAATGYYFDGWYLEDVKTTLGTEVDLPVKTGYYEVTYVAKFEQMETRFYVRRPFNNQYNLFAGTGSVVEEDGEMVPDEVPEEGIFNAIRDFRGYQDIWGDNLTMEKGNLEYDLADAVKDEENGVPFWRVNVTPRMAKVTFRSSDPNIGYMVSRNNQDRENEMVYTRLVNDTAPVPALVIKDGYVFDGWYMVENENRAPVRKLTKNIGKSGDKKLDVGVTHLEIRKDVVYEARFKAVPVTPPTPGPTPGGGGEPTPGGGGGEPTPPAPTPVPAPGPAPVIPAAPADGAAVLGARRTDGDTRIGGGDGGAQVLGARRGQTGEESQTKNMMVIAFAAAAAVALSVLGRRKKED